MSTVSPSPAARRGAARRERPRVLMVDDEIAILEGFELNLSRTVDVTCAGSGAEALRIIADGPPFAVITSDMRMPGMDGATFLAQARQAAPDAVRMLLTGQTDLDSAIAAMNTGGIFRFLTKPCPHPILMAALEDALEQHRLILAERVLLRETLPATVRVLTHALGAPARGDALRQRVLELCHATGRDPWRAELAAMFCEIGCVFLPPQLAGNHFRHHPLNAQEQAQVDRLPVLADELLAHIPRLDGVRDVLRLLGSAAPTAPWEARALRVLRELERLEGRGFDHDTALAQLAGCPGEYDAEIVAAVRAMHGGAGLTPPPAAEDPSKCVFTPLADIRAGARTAADILDRMGRMLVEADRELTPTLLDQLRVLAEHDALKDPARIAVAPV
ncbi:MAG: response regulator [Thermoleophilia bacterium]